MSRRFAVAGACALAGRPRLALAAHEETSAAPRAVIAGALLPLSGAEALAGDECARGVALAVADINASGGIASRELVLLTGDAFSQSQTGPAASALLGGGKAGLLLGSGISALSYPGSAAAELAQVPYIELVAPADGITGRGFKFLLRSCETASMIAAVATAAISAAYAGRKIGVLFNTGATAGSIVGAALAAWRAAKVTPLLVVGYPEDIADLHEPVSRLRRAGAEIVLHVAGPDDVLQFFQAMRDINWRPAAIFGGGGGYLMRETADALGQAFDGVFAVGAPYYPARAEYLAAAYEARYAVPPRSADSLTCYVGAKLVFDVLNMAGGDPAKLLDALRRTDIPLGTLANGWGAAFDKTGQNTRAGAMLQQWRGQMLSAVG